MATLLVGLLTAAVSILALGHPDILRLLERHPAAEQPWASWRLLTSLLVHDGWVSMALNLAGFAVVGTAVEYRFGAMRWGALYLAGGIVGELVGISWQPIGAGNSVASFGLVGGLLSLLLGRASAPPGFATLYALGWVAAYGGLALGGIPGAVAAGVLFSPLGAVIARAQARGVAQRPLRVALGCGALLAALLLCVRRDIHGPPLIAGVMLGVLLRRASPSLP